MSRHKHTRLLAVLAALTASIGLGGCVAYPVERGYGGYYAGPYVAPPVVAYGGWGGYRGGWHHHHHYRGW